jgi:hypothetical protein
MDGIFHGSWGVVENVFLYNGRKLLAIYTRIIEEIVFLKSAYLFQLRKNAFDPLRYDWTFWDSLVFHSGDQRSPPEIQLIRAWSASSVHDAKGPTQP